MFETESDVLAWYEEQPRALTEDFVNSIPWAEVREHPLDPAFVPVLIYMRDVEAFTDIYYEELRRTPTGKSPVIKKFMDRWSVEEFQHATLLNRFLNEAGIPTSKKWFAEARAAIPFNYTFENRLYPIITNCFGTNFSAVHMTWGAINEMTTLQGYRRLWQLAKHPVLETLLRAIAQEEAAHSKFYWNIARLKLERSGFAQRLARTVISKFWTPVGQGTKPKREANYLIATLFKGEDGVDFFDRNVNERLERLPGFAGVKTITQRIARIAL
ncbi:MAG TPA: acyl-ACP desaturase [Pyrinomonadaceae bacterium]